MTATFSAMIITAIVGNDPIKLPPGIHLPEGTKVQIEAKVPEGKSVAERYARMAGLADDVSADLSRNLDYSIHGQTRKP